MNRIGSPPFAPHSLDSFSFRFSPLFCISLAMITYGVDSPPIVGVEEIGVFLSLVLFGGVALQGYA